jgi:hypothetical protein
MTPKILYLVRGLRRRLLFPKYLLPECSLRGQDPCCRTPLQTDVTQATDSSSELLYGFSLIFSICHVRILVESTGSSETLQENTGMVPLLGHDLFLPNPFHFVMYPTIRHCIMLVLPSCSSPDTTTLCVFLSSAPVHIRLVCL